LTRTVYQYHITYHTRSLAVAERLHDASCHWLFC